jgi:hypothetical protein
LWAKYGDQLSSFADSTKPLQNNPYARATSTMTERGVHFAVMPDGKRSRSPELSLQRLAAPSEFLAEDLRESGVPINYLPIFLLLIFFLTHYILQSQFTIYNLLTLITNKSFPYFSPQIILP